MLLVEVQAPDKASEPEIAARTGVYARRSRYTPPIGYARLDLYLTSVATRRMFDARSVRLQSATNETLQSFTLSHGSPLRGERPICAGLFTVYAHNTHFWEGLTFGGTVTISVHHPYTHVEMVSPAPIFVMNGETDPVQHLLIDELMAFVARHRAESHLSDSEYARHLAQTEPYQLFLSALRKLDDMVKHGTPSMGANNHPEVKRIVQRMIASVRQTDGWPANVPELGDLI